MSVLPPRGDEAQAVLAEDLAFALHAQADATAEILGEGQGLDQTLELAENAHAFADVMIGRVLGRATASERPACRRGCTACCYLHVAAAIPEVIRIAEYVVEHFSPEAQGALHARIAAHKAATAGMTGEERRQARIACPLLVEGDCSVYPARPIACRGWNSLDASRCDDDREDPRAGVAARLNLAQFLVAGRVAEGMALGVRHREADDRMLDLVRGLENALAHPDAADRWRGGEGVFDAAVNADVFPSPSDPEEAAARRILERSVAQALGWERPG